MKKLIICLLFVLPVISFSDMIYFKDGSNVSGKVLEFKQDKLLFNSSYGKIEIDKNKIKKIEISDSTQSSRRLKKAGDFEPDNWYMMISIGAGSSNSISEELKSYIKNSDFSFYMSIGAYATMNDHLLLGGRFIGDNWGSSDSSEETQTSGALLFDFIYFFDHVGDGFYINGGVGYSSIVLSNTYETERSYGAAIEIGFGVALNVDNSWAILGGVSYSYIFSYSDEELIDSSGKSEKWKLGTLHFYIGFLF